MYKLTRYIIFLILTLQMAIVIQAQSNLMSLTSDISCNSSCWLGIEPGITTEVQVEAILNSNSITYEKHPLGAEGSTSFFYDVTGGYSHPLIMGDSALVNTNQGVVTSIDMLLQTVEITDMISEFGNPTHILHYVTANIMAYDTENLVFIVIETDKNHVFKLSIMSDEILNLVYLNDPFWDDLETCTDTNQLCDVVSAISSVPICDINIGAGSPASLISAINTGNSAGSAYSICLANSIYTLNAVDNSNPIGANALPVITGDISIIGNGATLTRDVSAPDFRFFRVANGATLTLENLTLDNGHTSGTSDAGDGGAIYNDGTLTIVDSIFTGNRANIEAGAIYNNDDQILNITNSSFTDNRALGDDGGAIDNHGIVTISGTTFADNHADGDDGGAIWNDDDALLIISDSIFTLNSASDEGGIIMNFGTITLNNNIIANNSSGGDGGAISSDTGTITITNGNFSNNISGDDGGAIMTYAPLSLTGVTLDNNDASDKGGAIYVWDSDLLIDNSTLSNNESVNNGGAIYIGNASVSSYLLNSCVFANMAGNTSGVYAENDNFDATSNWWGATDGPDGSGNGNGDEVNSNVNFANFITSDCATAISAPAQTQSLAILASDTVPDSSNFPVVDLPYNNNFDDNTDFSDSVRWTRDETGAGWLLDTDIRGQGSSLEMTTWVELSNNPQISLSYFERAELASNDVISLEIQLQGSSDWIVLAQNSGTSYDWQESNISLANYRGETIRLRWHSDIPADAPLGENSLNYAIDELQISRR